MASNGNADQTELACYLERETLLVTAINPRVVSNGKARYSNQRAFESLLKNLQLASFILSTEFGWYRGGIPSSLLWMKGFLFKTCHCEEPWWSSSDERSEARIETSGDEAISD
jgi:hypothetical protein